MSRHDAPGNQAFTFQRPAILGATEMGALIAARFADAGVRVRLYDKPVADTPNALADAAINELLRMRPLPFAGHEAASLIDARNYRDHWNMLADHDLIIECSDDILSDKQSLLSRITPGLHRDAIILSATATLSVQAIARDLPAGYRPRFLGAHFFRPPRLHRGLELIPIQRTAPRTLERVQGFFRDLLGAETVIVPDSDNFAANRFLILAACSAFYHATQTGLSPATLTALSGLLCGYAENGQPGILAHTSPPHFHAIHARTPHSDRQYLGEKYPLPAWIHSAAQQHTASPPQQAIDRSVINAFQSRDWQTLHSLDHPQAQYLHRWLLDLWAAQAHLSEQLGLPASALDTLIRHGLGWPVTPHALYAAFSPRKILKTLDETDKQTLQNLKWPRPRAAEEQRQTPHPFEHTASLCRDLPGSRSYRHEHDLLIWQPKNTAVSFDAAQLDELATACGDARQEHRLLLIYHRGEHFGTRHDWLHEHRHHPARQEHAIHALHSLIMALRMLPRPVLASVSGDIRDEGLAILMQADRIIADMDMRCELSALAQGIPPLGGVCFEWLRRLPALSATVHLEQIHAAISHCINYPDSIGVHRMREYGLVRTHDLFVMNRAVLPQITLDLTRSWLNARLPRSYRVPQPALDPQAIAQLDARAAHTRNPALYRHMLALFAADPATPMLSLSLTLRREREQLLACLRQQPPENP